MPEITKCFEAVRLEAFGAIGKIPQHREVFNASMSWEVRQGMPGGT
jgi:hypothetical protein